MKALREMIGWVLALAGFTILGIVLYGLFGGGAAAKPSPPIASNDPIPVTADRLFVDYRANEVRADQLYRDRLLRVAGAVQAIRKFDRYPVLELRTPNEFETVSATFIDGETDLARLNRGDHVTMRCIGAGLTLGSPRLRHCVLERYTQ